MNHLKISEILINARTRQGITLSGVADETKIPLQHLESLERDDYDVFPNHALALGFLRSYVSFLDLDEDQISLLFQKNVNDGLEYKKNPLGKMAGGHVRPNYESTMPMKSRPSNFNMPSISLMPSRGVLIGLAGVAGVLFVGWLGTFAYSAIQTSLANKEQVVEWDGINIWEGSVRKGDHLILSEGEERIAEFTVSEVSPSVLSVKIGDKEYSVATGESHLIDFKGMPREDLTLSYDGDQVVLRPILESELLVTANTLGDRNALFPGIPFEFRPLAPEALSGSVLATAQAKPDLNSLKLTLKESSLIRYLADEGTTEEVFLQAGSVVDISFATSLLLWVANPRAVTATMGGDNLDLWGDSVLGIGQLIWVQTPKGSFELRFLPL